MYVQQVSSLTGISSQDRFSGLVVSENLMEIKKDSDKEVAELLVKEGQDVQEGDPLFSYDTDQLQLNADKLDLEREQRQHQRLRHPDRRAGAGAGQGQRQ